MCGYLRTMGTLLDSVNGALQYAHDGLRWEREDGKTITNVQYLQVVQSYINTAAVPFHLKEGAMARVTSLVSDGIRKPIVPVDLWD